MRCIFFSVLFIFSFLVSACQSQPYSHPGIQPGFEALNPAAVIAVPVFVLPNPSQESAVVDTSLVYTEKLFSLMETKILKAFENQPNINGYSYDIVRNALEKKPNTKMLLDQLNKSMNDVAGRFSSRDISKRILITPECLSRKNFLDFYSFCLSSHRDWLDGLNKLSFQVMNADSAIITVVNNLKNSEKNTHYTISLGVAVLLVDTNNGKLIWGNEANLSLEQNDNSSALPSYQKLIDNLFSENFWKGFPGRKPSDISVKKITEVH